MTTTILIRTLQTLEIAGGVLCLDLANTINSRFKPEHDYLKKYADLADWAFKVGILSSSQNVQLKKQAEQDTENAEKALRKALFLREMFYRIFSNLAKGKEPDQEDINRLVKLYAEAISQSSFVRKENHFMAEWRVNETFDAMLWPIIYSAGQLLMSEDLNHVKECPRCGWLFLDTSKNQSRRWCNMNTCGARDKMRRYHSKLRKKNS